MRKERILEIERLRGMAFLAVVLQHSIAHYSVAAGVTEGDGILMVILLMASKFAVPAFIFITGMVLFYNDSGQLQYGNFVKRRISDIYIPFAVWTIIHVAIDGRLQLGSVEGWTELGKMLITGKASSHLWYIIMLFQFYLLYPLYRSIILGISSRLTHRVNVILLVVTGVLFIVMTAYITDIGRWIGGLNIPVLSDLFTTYADRNALNFSFYFILGAAAGMNPEMWSKWIQRARPLYWTVFSFLFGVLLIQGINEIRLAEGTRITFYSLSLLRPWMALFLISSILTMYDLAGWICRRAGRSVNAVLSSLGLYSFGAYLMHLLTMRISYLVDESLLVSMPSLVRIISSWIISIALAYMGARLFALMPFGKWLAGVPGGRSRKQAASRRGLNTSAKM